MAHTHPRCIEWVSSIHALEPGDVLATGTNHRGLSAFQDGRPDRARGRDVGRLRVKVRDKLKRTWRARHGLETRTERDFRGATTAAFGQVTREDRRLKRAKAGRRGC